MNSTLPCSRVCTHCPGRYNPGSLRRCSFSLGLAVVLNSHAGQGRPGELLVQVEYLPNLADLFAGRDGQGTCRAMLVPSTSAPAPPGPALGGWWAWEVACAPRGYTVCLLPRSWALLSLFWMMLCLCCCGMARKRSTQCERGCPASPERDAGGARGGAEYPQSRQLLVW
jgi:hypothetical protein